MYVYVQMHEEANGGIWGYKLLWHDILWMLRTKLGSCARTASTQLLSSLFDTIVLKINMDSYL